MRKLLMLLAALLALPVLCAAQGGAWGVWANRMNPGLPWTDPCNIQYVISPSPGRYDQQPEYVRVRSAANRSEADRWQRLFSQFYDDQPDSVVKMTACHASSRRPDDIVDGGPGGNGGGANGGVIRALEYGTNRYGGDYNDAWAEADGGSAASCSARCAQEGQCRSFSWVKPGVQGRVARCWLKHTVPSASRNDCCISGVKTGD